MNCPIKQILLKPETSGRLKKWAIELGEHDISYRPSTSNKGQALADLLLKILREVKTVIHEKELSDSHWKKGSQEWTLYTDGASRKEGSGAGLIQTSPSGEEFTYTLRLYFHTSNNEAEYEALLVGLLLARQMDANAVIALAVNQINGEFEAKDK